MYTRRIDKKNIDKIMRRRKLRAWRMRMPKFKMLKNSLQNYKQNVVLQHILKNPLASKRPEPFLKKLVRTSIYCFITAVIFGFFIIIASIGIISLMLPSSDELRTLSFAQSTQIVDRNGKLLYSIHGEENRQTIGLSEISQYAIDATIAIEDKDFYTHPGIDTRAIIRCVIQNFRCGGSTITQQFIKNNFLSPERSYIRKIKEAILAIKLEKNFSKDEILEMYLNKIPYGNNAHGIQFAAKTYFNKDAAALTLGESIILASLPKAPSYYSPYGQQKYSHLLKEFDEEDLKKRTIEKENDLKEDEYVLGLIGSKNKIGENQEVYIKGRTDLVLERMRELGYITEEEKKAAWAEVQNIEFQQVKVGIKSPHFVLYIRELLEEKYGKDLVEQGGFKVYTTLDAELQEKAEQIITGKKEEFKNNYNVNNVSLLTVNPKTGHILAMVGSADYFDTEIDGNVNVVLRPRQPGSAFKPFVYALMFEKGYSPATVIYDVPTKFGPDEPRNFDGTFMGPISVRVALGRSRNIPAIKSYFLVGRQEPIISLVQKFGITSLNENVEYGYPLALGSGEVSLLEMVTAYSVFANSGKKHPISPIVKIENALGDVLEETNEENTESIEVLDKKIAFLINNILSDTEISFGRNLQIEGHNIAAKTGTSTKKLSNDEVVPSNLWVIGYTPSVVTGVWAGNTDGSRLGSKADGYNVAGSVFNAVMSEALKGTPNEPFPIPEGMEKIRVSKANGLLPGPATPEDQIIEEYFLPNFLPNQIDESFVTASIDTTTGHLATPYCPKDQIVTKNVRIYSSSFADLFPTWEEDVQKWVNEKIEAGELKDALPAKECPMHTAETILQTPTIKITAPAPFSAIPYGQVKVETDFNAPLGANRVEYYINDQLQYMERDKPFSGILRISKTYKSGAELKIKVIGYDDLEYSAQTQITVKLE